MIRGCPARQLRDPQRVLALAQRVKELGSVWWANVALAQIDAGQYREALETCEKASRAAEQSGVFAYVTAVAYWHLGRQVEARELARQVRQNLDSQPNQYWYIPEHRWRAREVSELMGLEIEDLKPRDPEKVLRNGIELYRKLAEERPDDVSLLRELGNRSSELYRLLRSAGRDDESRQAAEEAEGTFTKAINLKPAAWESWNYRAFLYFNLQQWNEAVADFSKAIELAPNVHTNWWHRGHCYLNLAQWDKAAANFEEVLEQWPEGGEGWYLRGVALAKLNQPEKAMTDLREAIRRGFTGVEWMKNDARLDALRTREDFGKLLREFEQRAKSEGK
jgi:tetratricopeptide (TPR) repeat protein